jgi:hypothetical protein
LLAGILPHLIAGVRVSGLLLCGQRAWDRVRISLDLMDARFLPPSKHGPRMAQNEAHRIKARPNQPTSSRFHLQTRGMAEEVGGLSYLNSSLGLIRAERQSNIRVTPKSCVSDYATVETSVSASDERHQRLHRPGVWPVFITRGRSGNVQHHHH